MGFTIYCHTNTVTQKRYVGLTKHTLEQRWGAHQSAARRNRGGYFASAIAKYGAASFASEVLEVVDTRAAANEAEQWWIAHFGSDDPSLGYNLTNGGASCEVTAASRAKIVATMMATTTPELRSERARVARKARGPASKATLEKSGANIRAAWAAKSEEEKTRLSEISRARYDALSPEEKNNVRARLYTPEARAKKSASAAASWASRSDESKAADALKISQARTKAEFSAASLRAWATRRERAGGTCIVSSETRAKISAGHTKRTPEARQECARKAGAAGRAAQTADSRKRAAEGIKARWASKTPEQRAEFAKKISDAHARRKAGRAEEQS